MGSLLFLYFAWLVILGRYFRFLICAFSLTWAFYRGNSWIGHLPENNEKRSKTRDYIGDFRL